LVIYQQGFALVTETRRFRFQPGLNRIVFRDIPEKIDPASVRFEPQEAAGKLELLEQDYAYDLLTPQALLKRYVGKEVELFEKIEGQVKEKRRKAILLSVGQPNIYRIDGQIHLGHPGRVVVEDLPQELALTPTLNWLVAAKEAKDTRCRISYLTQGLGWQAEYLGLLSQAEDTLQLDAWVEIDNQSGLEYPETGVWLVAGEVRRLAGPKRPIQYEAGRAGKLLAERKALSLNKPQAVADYYLYKLPRKISLGRYHKKQLHLLHLDGLEVRRTYLLESSERVLFPRRRQLKPQPLDIVLEFDAPQDQPLPAGRLRLFKAETGKIVMLGEDTLRHTPAGEKVQVTVGQAADVEGLWRQVEMKKMSGKGYQAAYEVEVINHKSRAVAVKLREHLPQGWQMLHSSQPYETPDADTLEYTFTLPPKGRKTVTYKVEVKY